MRSALKASLRTFGLLEPARRLRRSLERVSGACGLIPHKASERQQYWEARGKVFFDQVQPLLTQQDPAYHAQQEFLDALSAIEWESALEVGCGFGWQLRALRNRYPDKRIVGVDFSLSQLQRGREYLNGSGVLIGQADAARLPFADEAFDLVMTSGALIYVHARALPDVLAELRRVARRSVVLLEYAREHMDSPVRQALMDDADWHGHQYTTALRQAGLKVVTAFPFRAYEASPERVPFSFFHGSKA